MFLSSVFCKAQHEQKFTLQPKVGFSYSKLTGKGSNENSFVFNMLGGVEGQYDFSDNLGLALGVLYGREGCDYGEGASVKLDYILMPLTLNVYVASNFAIKIGPQFGVLTKATAFDKPYTELKFTDGKYEHIYHHPERNVTSDCNKLDLGVNIGLSYEWKNVVLDGRFAYSFTKIQKDVNYGEQNMALYLTLGYRFDIFGSSK